MVNKVIQEVKSFFRSVVTPDHYASYEEDTPDRCGTGPELTGLETHLPTAPGVELDAMGLDGTTAVPAVDISWSIIEKALDEKFPELAENLGGPATAHDLVEFERDLGLTLPQDVKQSYMIHDGQERGGSPAGLIFGITFLDLESIAEEWEVWKRVAVSLGIVEDTDDGVRDSRFLSRKKHQAAHVNPKFREQLPKQDSVPKDAIQPVYAHPSWIPLAKDWCGNNIAIDLAPGPKGTWGQVILFGHDQDVKYVVARNWAEFLANLARDIESDHFGVDPDGESVNFMLRNLDGVLIPVSYFSVLKRRSRDIFHDSVAQNNGTVDGKTEGSKKTEEGSSKASESAVETAKAANPSAQTNETSLLSMESTTSLPGTQQGADNVGETEESEKKESESEVAQVTEALKDQSLTPKEEPAKNIAIPSEATKTTETSETTGDVSDQPTETPSSSSTAN